MGLVELVADRNGKASCSACTRGFGQGRGRGGGASGAEEAPASAREPHRGIVGGVGGAWSPRVVRERARGRTREVYRPPRRPLLRIAVGVAMAGGLLAEQSGQLVLVEEGGLG